MVELHAWAWWISCMSYHHLEGTGRRKHPCSILSAACTVRSFHNIKKQAPHRGGFRGFLETKFPGKQMPPGTLDLLERMLRLDPKKRISAMEAFKARPPHPACGAHGSSSCLFSLSISGRT